MTAPSPSMARRVQYHRYGGPDQMRLEEFEPARPGPGEVRVRVRAAAANVMDWKIRSGDLRMITGEEFPRGVGTDFAGVLDAVGPGVARLRPGDEVVGGTTIRDPGSFAEMVIAHEDAVVRKPQELSFQEAAAIPTVGLTAFQAIVREGRVGAGQKAFVHGCLGGVGRAAVQLALSLGALVGGSCRTSDIPAARALGISPVAGYDVHADMLPSRFDLVLDTAGTLPYDTARALLERAGRIIDINPTPQGLTRSAQPGPYQVMVARTVTADIEEVVRAAARTTLEVPVARVVSLEEAIPALTALELRHTPRGGKLVMTID